MLLSKSDAGTSITQTTWDLAHNTISIPAGKGGALKRVEIQFCPTRETVVDGGGLVYLHNSSADWDPFQFVSASDTTVTEGGGTYGAPVVYEVNKMLPGNSDVTSDFRPYDDQTQHINQEWETNSLNGELTVVWELGGKPDRETFSGAIHPLKAAAVTSTARASPGNYSVPGGKGGRIVYLVDLCFPTVETILNSGGLRELECDAYDMTPCERYTAYCTTTGASGGGSIRPDLTIWDAPCPANATFTRGEVETFTSEEIVFHANGQPISDAKHADILGKTLQGSIASPPFF